LAGHPFWSQFPRVFTFSPWDNPGRVETEIVDFLKQRQASQESQQAIGALAALGLGMLVLFALERQ
jgi:hypothetical protein